MSPYVYIYMQILFTKKIGTLLSLVHCMRNVTLLHQAFVNLSHDGSSNKSVKTVSSSSKFVSSPSPLNVLKFILSADRFLVNLQIHIINIIFLTHQNIKIFLALNFAQTRTFIRNIL